MLVMQVIRAKWHTIHSLSISCHTSNYFSEVFKYTIFLTLIALQCKHHFQDNQQDLENAFNSLPTRHPSYIKR
jgi:hypothetical protein